MNELDRFKEDIDLVDFAGSRGYAIEERESWRGSVAMRGPSGDKIIISKGSGKWVFYSVKEQTNGTIIDFVQRHDGGSLGDVRKVLRNWCGSTRPVPLSQKKKPKKKLGITKKDRGKVQAEWEKTRFKAAVPYLTGRGIGEAVLTLPRFFGKCRIDWRQNVIFPHYDKKGLCGFEKKNHNFTGFAKGGIKGLWFSHCFPDDKSLVISETAIDSISHYVLKPSETTRYLSIGGGMNEQQPDLIRASMEKMPTESEVILAFDNDKDGERYTDEVTALAPPSVIIRRDKATGKDWNHDLKTKLGLN
ncbi:MAG TPA: hypothetical protein DD400_01100 [Rhodospirillaceae bacterium]|nr:hypothetical protein [Rhodospirillaceae bacterium]